MLRHDSLRSECGSASLLTALSTPGTIPYAIEEVSSVPVDYEERPCELCGKSFTGKRKSVVSNLSRHRRNQHGANKNETWSCDYCSSTFNRSDNLKTHVQTNHDKEPNQLPNQQ